MEKPPEKENVKIQPRGSFFEVDEDGYVVNPTSYEKIQKEWKPVIDDTVEWYKETFSDDLINVYIRGSVAKGEAIKNMSDLDTFAFVDLQWDEIEEAFTNSDIPNIKEKYSFVTDVEIHVEPIERSEEQNNVILLNQSLCVYGEPLDVPKLKPGKEMVIHAPYIGKRLEKLERFMNEEQSDEDIQETCVWFMKGLLRSGCEIVMERSGKYTRDLYPCYKIFSQYYPKKEKDMKEVLQLALNPTTDKSKIEKIMKNIGGWMKNEAEKHL